MKQLVFFFTFCFMLPAIIKAQVYREMSGTTVTFSGYGTIEHSDVPHGVEKVIIKEGITSIGYCAFDYCCNLTSVVVPKSVTSIKERAFYHCCSLMSINIPGTITAIGKNAFGDCSKLTNINISVASSIGEEAFKRCSNLTSINILGSVTTIGDHAFIDCSKLTSISMPNSVLSIGISAFRGCCSLTSITIPNSCTSIERFAFADCSSLKSIIIPNSVTSIGSNTFEGCSSLKSISIPNSVTSIGSNAFYKCSNLSSIHSLPTFVLQDYKWIHLNLLEEAIYAYISEHQNEEHIRPFAQGIDDKINRINREKRIKAKGGYTNVSEVSNGSKKYWKVSKGGRYGLTDSEGKENIPCEMEALESAGTGYLKYKINGFWGVMNYAGKIIIGTERGYTSIGDFKTFNKRFPYTMNGYKGECDATGRQISKIKVETPRQNTSVASSSSSSSSSSNSSSSNNSGNKTTTVVVEHHRDPIPVQEWETCTNCWGEGRVMCLGACGGTGTYYVGDRLHRCSSCGGTGKKICPYCGGQGGKNVTVYR